MKVGRRWFEMFGIGTGELFLILLVTVLLFGGNRVVDIAKGLGRGIREFKKSLEEFDPTEDSIK